MNTTQITIRRSRDEDRATLIRLATIDSKRYDGAPALLAEAGGEVVAALPVHGGDAIADPFRRTAELVDLLELRAAQIRAQEAERRPGGGAVTPLRARPELPAAA